MTPETDAKASPIIGFYSCATVPAAFARELERQRDEARETADRYRAAFCSAKGNLVPQVFPWEAANDQVQQPHGRGKAQPEK